MGPALESGSRSAGSETYFKGRPTFKETYFKGDLLLRAIWMELPPDLLLRRPIFGRSSFKGGSVNPHVAHQHLAPSRMQGPSLLSLQWISMKISSDFVNPHVLRYHIFAVNLANIIRMYFNTELPDLL